MTYFFALNFYLSSENNGLATVTDSFKPLYFSSENDEWIAEVIQNFGHMGFDLNIQFKSITYLVCK